jgi:fructokinase
MNVAIHLARLGHRVTMLSRVGRDRHGEELIRFMEKASVDTSLIQVDPDLPTSEVLITLDAHNNATYEIPHPVAWDRLEMNGDTERMVSNASLVVFGTLGSRHKVARDTILRSLESPAMKMIDVNLRPPFTDQEVVRTLLQKADVAKLNDDELVTIAGWEGHKGKSEKEIMEWAAERYGLKSLVVTRGKEGAVCYEDSRFYDHPGYRVEVADTVGAGDAFLAGYIHSHLSGSGPGDSLDFACRTGAFVASRTGGTPWYSFEDIREIE